MRISDWSSDVCSSDLVDIAWVLAVEAAHPHRQRLRERDVQPRSQGIAQAAAVANGVEPRLDPARDVSGRGVNRHIFDQAAHAVGAIERALRTAQDLDPLKI